MNKKIIIKTIDKDKNKVNFYETEYVGKNKRKRKVTRSLSSFPIKEEKEIER